MTTTSTAIPAPVPRSGLLDLLSLVGASGLVGLFPLYFIYHFITAGGLVPTFLGGMFGAVTALVAALSLLPYLIIQGRFGGEAREVFHPELLHFPTHEIGPGVAIGVDTGEHGFFFITPPIGSSY